MADDRLTPKQRCFVEEYLIDFNATQAAIRAGYSEDSARTTGPENLLKPVVQEAIGKAIARRSKRTEVTADRVVRELARIAFLDARKVMEWGPQGVKFRPSEELDDDDAACIVEASETITEAGGTIRVKMADKMAALNLLAKHTGVAKDQLEITGAGGGPLVSEVVVEHHKSSPAPV